MPAMVKLPKAFHFCVPALHIAQPGWGITSGSKKVRGLDTNKNTPHLIIDNYFS